MIRIEYQLPKGLHQVIFADDSDEAMEICAKCDEYGYKIIDVSTYIDFDE